MFASLLAVTVTVCGIRQSVRSKVRLVRSSLRAVPEWPVIVTVTLADGCVPSRTVYSMLESSSTVYAGDGMTNPATSSSSIETTTDPPRPS